MVLLFIESSPLLIRQESTNHGTEASRIVVGGNENRAAVQQHVGDEPGVQPIPMEVSGAEDLDSIALAVTVAAIVAVEEGPESRTIDEKTIAAGDDLVP